MVFREARLHPSRTINIRRMFFVFLINGLCSGFYNVILQPYLVDFIASESVFGLVMTMSSLAQILPMLLAAKVSDRIGRKRVYLAGTFLIIPSVILFALASHDKIGAPVFLVVTGLMVVSMSFGFSDPARNSLVAESSDVEKRASSFSFVNLAFYVTAMIGPIIIRIFSDRVPLSYYFYGLIGGNLLLFIFQLFSLKEPLVVEGYSSNKLKQFIQSIKAIGILYYEFIKSLIQFLVMPFVLIYSRIRKNTNQSKYTESVEKDYDLFRDIFKNPGVKYAIGFFIFDAFVWGLSLNIYNGAVKYVYGYNESHIAMMQLVLNISTIVFFIPLTIISDKLKRNQLLFYSLLTGSLFFTMNIIGHFANPKYLFYLILVGWAGLGASIAFWVPGILSIVTDFNPNRRAEVYGMVTGIKSLGWFPTGFLAGFIIEKTKDQWGLLITFLISICLFPFELFLAWKFPTNSSNKIEEKETS
jgi:MFS family permease